MITTQHEGVAIHTDAEGSIIQSTKVTNKREIDEVLGMVDGKTQVVGGFDFKETNEFNVTGKGDLTFAAGIADTDDVNLSLLTGGFAMVRDFDFEENLGKSSQWAYSGTHYPFGTN